VESNGRERLMMDGKAGKAVRSEFHSPEAHGVNSVVWVQERAGHKGQGSSPRSKHPINLSWVSAPDVRYCQIKTMSHVERKIYWSRPQGHHSRVQSEVAWLNWVVGFIGGAKPWGRERVSGL
jgi:hypothetical protein